MADEFFRPYIPYPPEQILQNSDRYALLAADNQSPTALDLDGDFNYIIDSLNSLYETMQGINAGILDGADEPENVHKFPATDGNDVIIWVKVTEDYINDNSIPGVKLSNGSIPTSKYAAASVTRSKIAPGSINGPLVQEGSLPFNVIEQENSGAFQEFFNEQDDGSLSGAKIQENSLPADATAENSFPGNKILDDSIPPQKIQNNSITAQQIQNNTITTQQLAPVIQPLIGQIIIWPAPGIVAPPGYLFPWGQQNISRAQYALLFAVYGITYGAGDGVTTFGLPDLRGRCIFALDMSAANTNAATGGRIVVNPGANNVPALTVGTTGVGGEQNHTLTVPEIPSHNHTYTGANRNGTAGSFPNNEWYGTVVENTSNSGGDQAHNNMPPFLFLQALIYTGVVAA